MYYCFSGYYCVPELSIEGNSASAKNICPMGFFCPNGTGHDWQPCPAGTYGLSQGLKKAEDCTPCTGGQYCEGIISLLSFLNACLVQKTSMISLPI